MKRQCSTILSVFLAAVLLTAEPTSAGKLYCHCYRTRTSSGITHYGHDIPRFGATEFAVANAAVGEGEQQHIQFHFRATALTVDHLELEQVGLAIYKSDGKLIATGRITNGGGDGGLIGNNVIIRIRAYVASSPDPNQIPPDAVVVWESECNLWVPRGRKYVSLVPRPSPCDSAKLRRHFDQITHLQVEMEFHRDP